MKIKFYEKFFDYTGYYYIYQNPSDDEFNKFVPDGARGFIDRDGNLYVEGYEDVKDPYGHEDSSVIHEWFMNDLVKKLEYLPDDYPGGFYNDQYIGQEEKYGVCVQMVVGLPKTFRVSESVIRSNGYLKYNKAAVSMLFQKAEKKNPTCKFMRIR